MNTTPSSLRQINSSTVSRHNTEFLSTLNKFLITLRNMGISNKMSDDKQIDIINPQITILAGTQPSYLANLLPEEAWGQGFMSRVFMVYSNSKRRSIDIFDTRELSKPKFKLLSDWLSTLTKLYGPVRIWDYSAASAAQNGLQATCSRSQNIRSSSTTRDAD